jgi:nucleotide sugar dehydrogenase
MEKKIGFIGQGFLGKNYADDFEKRGLDIVRYSLEEPYVRNRSRIKDCDIVFIAVPTPTRPEGFDDSIIRQAVKLVGKDKTAVIKSTILPGTVESIQAENPDIFVMHSPEFLTAVTAAHDAANPERNIVGIPKIDDEYKRRAREVIEVLPRAPYDLICSSREAELIKYGGNCLLYLKVVFMNMLYDFARELDCDYAVIKEALAADPRLGKTHLDPVHQSGRGAGGHCFIKDFAAFSNMYMEKIEDARGKALLESIRDKNIDLLVKSQKDLELLRGVYGEDFIDDHKQ